MLILLSPLPAAAGGTGTTGMNFLKIAPGAKAAASGGAFTAVADDGSAFYWNPAGLVQQRYPQVSLMHLSWLEGVNYQYASYIQPTLRHGTFGIGLCYLSVNDIPSYDNAGARRNGNLGASDAAVVFSYARQIGGFELGTNVKYLREQLADETAAAYAFDAGALYRLKTGASCNDWIGPECRVALTVQNIGPAVSFISDTHPLPLAYRLGLAQDFFSSRLTLSLDGIFSSDAGNVFAAGFDYRVADWVSLRAGFRLPSETSSYDIQPGLMGGIGFGNGSVSVDYAFVPFNDFGGTHRIAANYRFGKAFDRDRIETKLLHHRDLARRHVRDRDLVNAYREYSNVLLLDPVNREAKTSLAKIQKEIDGIKAENYLAEARQLILQDKLIEARGLLETVLQLIPDNAAAHDCLADITAILDKQKEQREDSVFNQGMEFFAQKRYADAISLWEKILLVNPGHTGAKEQIALAKTELAKIDENRRQNEQARLQKKAENIVAQAKKAYRDNRWEKAQSLFKEALTLSPGNKEIESSLSDTRVRLAAEHARTADNLYAGGKLQAALQCWEQAAALAPQDQTIAGRLATARAELKEANSTKAEEFSRRGLKAYGLGDLSTAVASWEKALVLDPDNGTIKNNLARAKEELKRKK
jgi:tetratricopeptide (TPR) repeat protein